MHEKVKEFLEAKKSEERKVFEEKKQKKLIELGLFEKEYAPEGIKTSYSDYPENEYDTTTNSSKWYKKVAIDVTDEEYAEILKHTGIKESGNNTNGVATVLTSIAWIVYFAGFIGSFILMNESVVAGFVGLFSTVISGTMFLGFAEIIKLLDKISKK